MSRSLFSARWFVAWRIGFALVVFWIEAGSLAHAEEPEAGTVEFFETRIRPVLVERCYECHSAAQQSMEGGLALDGAVGWQTGGDRGPAVIAGDPERSLLMAALRYEDAKLEMPPDGRLSDAVIEDFRRWIEAGAVDPRTGDLALKPHRVVDIEAGRRFWSFQPPKRSAVPQLQNQLAWTHGSIDAFIAERQESAGIQPVADTDPATAFRRLAFDLTGLPPSPDDLKSYVEDPTPRRWRRMVDQMLASRDFAEHWGRHWLDVARYADSNGGDFNATFHHAWRYRNWVIDAIGDDLPYDEFVRLQIAGDLLPGDDESQRVDHLVASTYLMLGAKMLSERNKEKLRMDVVDEQIDAVGKTFMGMTLGCARCHDHKFDPIPTEDYYALAGIFASTRGLQGESQRFVSTWPNTPLPADAGLIAAHEHHRKVVDELNQEIKQAQAELERAKQGVSPWRGVVLDDVDAKKVGAWKASTQSKTFVGAGYIHDDNRQKGECSVIFSTRVAESSKYRLRCAFAASSNRATNVPLVVRQGDKAIPFEYDQRTADEDDFWRTLGEVDLVADVPIEIEISNKGTQGYVLVDAIQILKVGEPTRGASEPGSEQKERIEAAQASLKAIQDKLKAHQAEAPPPLPMAMAPADLPTKDIQDANVCIRGEVEQRGAVVPRGFLQVCSFNRPSIPEGASGRVELAQWLTDPDHPLVARVLVNRVWMHLTGAGLVRTVDNFGVQGEEPTHPELLDTLAVEFVRDGWSIKRLVRRIVNSRVYQLSSRNSSVAAAVDPENRLFWRGNRRRIPAESLRDACLVNAGMLDRTVGHDTMAGFETLVDKNSGDTKVELKTSSLRTLYLPVIRNYVSPLLTTFDFADPDLIVGERPRTNVPSQTLVLLNSGEMQRYAQRISERLAEQTPDPAMRLEQAYLMLHGRMPDETEIALFQEWLGDKPDDPNTWQTLIHGLLASTPFRYLD